MATKETKGTTSVKTADAAQGDVGQTAAAAPADALPPTPPATSGEQNGDQTAPAAPAAPAVLAPTDIKLSDELKEPIDGFRAPIGLSDVSAALQGGAKDTPELPSYLVTDVSSVLHDGTWYHQDDEIFLNDKDAAPLLRRRIIEPSRSDK